MQKMPLGCATMSLFGLSLALLLLGVRVDSLPVLSDSSQQPAWCRDPRPRSSQTSPCNEDEKVRRYFLHESNPKGCKIFGICPNDAAKYDNETTEYIYSEYNYFLSFEECQVECMQHVLCPEMSIGENVEVFSDNALLGWGRRVVFECTKGYSLSGNMERSTRTCQKNGTWSGVAPVCLKQCSSPPPLKHANLAPSKKLHNQGGTVHYACEVGYQLGGSAQRMCGSNGTWMQPEPSCHCQGQVSETDECTGCLEPEVIEHGQVSAPDRSLFAEIEYMCDPGYTVIGNQSRTCQENGLWSGKAPICWQMNILKADAESEDDVTNELVVLVVGSMNIKFRVSGSEPDPFKALKPQWTFNMGEEFPHGVYPSESCLTFSSVLRSKEQHGNYSVSLGNVTAFFKLEIQDQSPDRQQTTTPSILVLRKNPQLADDSAEFVCVLSGCPVPNVVWYHNNQVLAEDRPRITMSVISSNHGPLITVSVGTLKISNLEASDVGEYQCQGNNSAGTAKSTGIGALIRVEDIPGLQEDEAAVEKRSIEDSAKPQECDPDTVILLGQVRKQIREVRSSSELTTYRVQVRRFLRGSESSTDRSTFRTVVFEPQSGGERLKSNTDYVFRGRLIDKTLFVSRHDVQRHTSELERNINSELC